MSRKWFRGAIALVAALGFWATATAQTVIDDFETDLGNWKSPTYSGSTTGIDASSSLELSTDYAHTGNQSARLTLIDDAGTSGGWFVRLWNGLVNEVPSSSRLGIWIRGNNDSVRVRIVIKDTGTDGDNGYEAGPWHWITPSPDDWQFVEFDLAYDAPEGWLTGNGEITSTDVVKIDGLQFQCDYDISDTLYLDDFTSFPHVAPTAIDNFETDLGAWKDPNYSGSTTGILAESSLELSADYAHTGNQSARLVLLDDPGTSGGWFVREWNGQVNEVPANSRVGFWVRGHNTLVRARIVIKDTGTDGDNGYEAGPWHWITASADDWQLVDFDLVNDAPEGWLTGNGEITSTDVVKIDGIQFQCAADTSDTLYIDDFGYFPAVGQAANLVINEIMFDPYVVSDAAGEWFEIYNPEIYDVNLQNWIVEDLNGEHFKIDSTVIVPAKGYAVLGVNADSLTNGGVHVDYAYSGFTLDATADAILLRSPDSTLVDSVVWDVTWPSSAGHSIELSSPDLDNSLAENWHLATVKYGAGDYGTPGAENGPPPNRPPVANAGPDRTVALGDTVTLDGTGSSDPDGDPLTYNWAFLDGPQPVAIPDPSAATWSFVPPDTGTYTFNLVVNDGHVDSAPDTVAVKVVEAVLRESWWTPVDNVNFRGVGVDPRNGRVYITDTKNRQLLVYKYDNNTATPDRIVTFPEFASGNAAIAPYGVDVADDGTVYVSVWKTWSSGAIYQISPDLRTISEIGVYDQAGIRGISVVGGGANTKIYAAANNGDHLEFMTNDGVSFALNVLFNHSGYNQIVVASADGQRIYSTGLGTGPILKYNRAGNVDSSFSAPSDITNANGLVLANHDSVLYAVFSVGEQVYLGKLDAFTGAEIAPRLAVGPSGINPPIRELALVGDHLFWTAYGNPSYRGLAIDTKVVLPNRAPLADAGPDIDEARAGETVTLDGTWSADLDGDPLTYHWAFVSGPEQVTLTGADTPTPSFTPTELGDYAFSLVVNDGNQDSAPDTVWVHVISRSNDLNLTFEDDSDKPNWGVYSVQNRYTSVIWDSTGGVGGSGAMLFKDSGWGFAIERPIKATPGTPFHLQVAVKVHGIDQPLFLQVAGITYQPVGVDIHEYTDFTTVELTGIAVAEDGWIQILGETRYGPDSVWVDNLVYDDDAPLPTYSVRGTVTLSDNPADQSGTIVTVLETGFADTTNAAGAYEIGGLINGLYTLAFHHDFYKDRQDTVRVQDADAVLDVTLQRNHKPIADAGADISGAQVARYVYLDGSGSYDPDGDSLTYAWTQTSGPSVILGNADKPVAGFRPDTLGTYVFTLVVSDGTENSDPDSVTVEVTVPGPESYGYEYVSDFPGADTNVHGVGVDPEGKVWIGSYGGNSGIQVRYPDGTPAPFSPVLYGVAGEDTVWLFNRCRGIEIGPDGMVYVSTSTAEGGPAILKFDYHTGQPLGGVRRNASPAKVGVDQDGHIFVANVAHAANGYKITIYNADFDSIGVIDASPANGGPDFGFTRAIEASPDGQKIFVGDLDHGAVYLFEGSVGSGYSYTGEVPGPFLSVQGLDLDHHMRLWVHDGVQNSGGPYFLHIYSPDLEVRESVRMEGENRGAGFAMNDSLVYIIDFLRHKVERWAIKGTQVPPLATPLSIVARDDNNGKPTLLDSVVTVSGFVTASNQFGSKGPVYIQDALVGNVGLAIYDRAVADSVKIGDRVSVTGKVGFFRGLTEIVDVQSFNIWSGGYQVEPRVITCADLANGSGEALEGVLVKIRNVTTTASEFPSNGTITISDNTGSATVFIDRDTDIPGTTIAAQTFDIVGVVGQYDPEAPYWQGYQLLPRSKDDVLAATGVAEEGHSALPKEFALYQNYPNPFNPTTTIRYDLPKPVHVKIEVYNVLGQKVATLVDELQTPGFKSIQWDGTDQFGQPLSSGTYIYRIQAGDFVRTRKMTMLK